VFEGIVAVAVAVALVGEDDLVRMGVVRVDVALGNACPCWIRFPQSRVPAAASSSSAAAAAVNVSFKMSCLVEDSMYERQSMYTHMYVR
jgi:hypothetical protein